ncbi:MAG TPA: hypothetical protein VK717_07285 [Opitutaceae bacterium]|nr:hypothetical protein [Opitutaceae bacterium]
MPVEVFALKCFHRLTSFPPVTRAIPVPLPDLTRARLLDRVTEALQVGISPERAHDFPRWTQRVMRILKEQFVPREYASILSADKSILVEGIMVAWTAKARDLVSAASHPSGGKFARELAGRLDMDPKTTEVAIQVESGMLVRSDEFQKHVMTRLFTSDFAERCAFIEGLAIGNRLSELLDRQAKRSTTDATGIYLLLWLYWPEISKLKSVGEVARVLEPFFTENKNLAGAHWDERIRKLANRIELSFRVRQKRIRKRKSA